MLRRILFVFAAAFFLIGPVYAATPSSGQTAGGIARQQSDIERGRRMEERIEKKSPQAAEGTPAPKPASEAGPKALIKTVRVEGAHLLPAGQIEKIVAPFEGRELSLEEMQQAADQITEAYRQKGYVTSRAYIPVQSIKDNVLTLKVLEAKAGTVEIQGNKHFKTARLRKDLDLGPEGYFDFSALQKSLVFINEHPDRLAKAVLVPGKEPGTTDVVVQVADRQPIHAGFQYDNYASRFVKKNEYSLIIEDNNLTGHDDLLYLKGQLSDDSLLSLEEVRYLYSIDRFWDVGVYALNSHLRLDKDFKDLDATGDAHVYGIFATRKLIKDRNVDLRLNMGFDYKSIRDKLQNVEVSNDELRVLKLGFDLDFEDSIGRDILTANLNSGLPDLLGGSSAKDPASSRVGAGGRFDKGEFTFFHLQSLPWGASFLWKNVAQASKSVLPASEQFQIGGALSVRGYPPAEFSGDSGIYSSPEVSFPVYFLPKEMKLPLTRDENLYNDLRLVVFYDVATAHLNNPLAGQDPNQTLRGYGYGLRLNIKDNMTLRVEVGYPEGRKASDHRSAHPWIEFTVRF